MRRQSSALVCTFLLVVVLFTVLMSARAQNPPSDAPQTAAQSFKNVQVMKDVPAEEIIPAMQFISASLGVECTYCHVERAFEKDDKKEKKFARHMIEMTMNINKDNFEAKRWVTCYSCHRGAAKPVSIPIISAEEKMPEMMAGDAVDKSSFSKAQALLDKYLASIGGTDSLKKISSRVQKGTVTLAGNQKIPIDIYAKAPNKRVSAVHFKERESLTAFDGKAGWMAVPGPRTLAVCSRNSRSPKANRSTATQPGLSSAKEKGSPMSSSILTNSQACSSGWSDTSIRPWA